MMLDKKQIATMSLFFIALLYSQLSFADVPQDNTLDNIIDIYKTATQVWEPVIHNLTMGLFWGLVTISFTWSSIQIHLKGGGLVDVLADLTTRVMTIGVSVWLVTQAPNLARSVISSFHYIGSQLSGGDVNFSPSNIVELATNIIANVWDKASVWKPMQALMMFVSALIILICFALIAMEMTILIVSSYIIVSGGIIMMGFLGSEWTRENALNYFTAVLGVATKMFVMQLILILGYGFIHDMLSQMTAGSSDAEYIALLIVSIVFCGLIREIPQIAASLASGRFTMAGGGLQAALGAAAGVTVGAAVAATGAGAEGYSAFKSSMSDSETADNETSALKRSLDTGSSNPGSGGSSGGGTTSGASPGGSSGGGGNGMPSAPRSVLSSSSASPSSSASSPSQSTNNRSATVSAGSEDNGQKNAETNAAPGGESAGEAEFGSSAAAGESNSEGIAQGAYESDSPPVSDFQKLLDERFASEKSSTGSDTPATSPAAEKVDATSPPSPSGIQRVARAAGAATLAMAKASGKAAAISTVNTVTQNSSLGSALARSGMEMLNKDRPSPGKAPQGSPQMPGTQKKRKPATPDIANIAKDDGNDPNNYRDNLKAEDDERNRTTD